MRLSSFVISILIIGLVVTGFYSLINTMAGADAYGVNVDGDYQDNFAKTQAVSANITENYEDIQNWTVDKTSFLALVPEVVSMAKNVLTLPFSVTGDLIGDGETGLTGALGLPDWVATFLVASLAAMLIFALFALILRYRYT